MAVEHISARELLILSQAALSDAIEQSHPASAWELLQERDAEGNPHGSRPYTEGALAELERAQKINPEDIGVVHHLAIAHHARAWDWELNGDPRAPKEWADALECWRSVASSEDFWAAMERKLHACEPTADPGPLLDARRNLLEDLLDIHVEFIRRYCETRAPQNAKAHLEIIQRAKIPPAVKKRLVERVFAAMTASVPAAKAAGAHDSALVAIERFLALFPDFGPALRMSAEIGGELLSTLSWQRDWEAITLLHQRLAPVIQRLSVSGELRSDALARPALENLTVEFMIRGYERASPYFNARGSGASQVVGHEEVKKTLELVMYWARLAVPHCSFGSEVLNALAEVLLTHAFLLAEEANDSYENRTDPKRGLFVSIELYRRVVEELEESWHLEGVKTELHEVVHSHLAKASAKLSLLEDERSMSELGWE